MKYDIIIKPKITGERDYFYEPYYIFDYLICEFNRKFISIFELKKYIRQFTGIFFAIGESKC